MGSLKDQPPGRPAQVRDPEKEELASRVENLERQVALYERREELRSLIQKMGGPDPESGSSTKKNSR